MTRTVNGTCVAGGVNFEDDMTEHDIQLLIHSRFMHEKYIVPNIILRTGEADLLIVRRSGYAEEFEIKLSKSDFYADKKKQWKHDRLKRAFESGISDIAINRFSYVMPDSLCVTGMSFPLYAGLYVASNRGLVCIKHPPLIHKKKYDGWDAKIAGSCSHRYMALRRRNMYECDLLLKCERELHDLEEYCGIT